TWAIDRSYSLASVSGSSPSSYWQRMSYGVSRRPTMCVRPSARLVMCLKAMAMAKVWRGLPLVCFLQFVPSVGNVTCRSGRECRAGCISRGSSLDQFHCAGARLWLVRHPSYATSCVSPLPRLFGPHAPSGDVRVRGVSSRQDEVERFAPSDDYPVVVVVWRQH